MYILYFVTIVHYGLGLNGPRVKLGDRWVTDWAVQRKMFA